MDGKSENDEKKGSRAAPYTSFKTFRTFIEDLHEQGIPSKIDRSVLRRFSGSVGASVLSGLRFLGLVDGNDAPTSSLRDLTGAFGKEAEWQPALRKVLEAAYGPVIAINLNEATPSQFIAAFKTYPGTEDVRRKAEVFFLNAARDCLLPVNKRIADHKRDVLGVIRRKKAETNGDGPEADEQTVAPPPKKKGTTVEPPPPAPPPPQATERSVYDVLLGIWRPGAMPQEVDAAVVTLLRWLRHEEEKTATEKTA
jgi:Family of unknown function (DUF5343)